MCISLSKNASTDNRNMLLLWKQDLHGDENCVNVHLCPWEKERKVLHISEVQERQVKADSISLLTAKDTIHAVFKLHSCSFDNPLSYLSSRIHRTITRFFLCNSQPLEKNGNNQGYSFSFDCMQKKTKKSLWYKKLRVILLFQLMLPHTSISQSLRNHIPLKH